MLSVEQAGHKEFKEFVQYYVNLEGEDLDEWDFFDRADILNFLLQNVVEIKSVLFKALV